MIDFKQKLEEKDRIDGIYEQEENGLEMPKKSKKQKRITAYITALIVIAIILSGRVIMSSQDASSWLPGSSFFNKLRHLVPSADKGLQGEDEDRVNILLLGIGGEGHDGAYLTDTIMLASIKPSTKQVSLISIPRDLSAPINGGNWRKVNNINAYAEMAEPGSGGPKTMEAFSQLLEIPIHYYVRVDFQGFIDIVDELGGIEVNVENTLDDYSYPILGQEDNPDYYARFEHLHIDSGWQKMDGSLALKYARSRHAYGPEGSDFARARRQQLIMEAVKKKLLSRQTLMNPIMIGRLLNDFGRSVSTNLDVWEMLRLWDLVKDIDRSQIINRVLSDAPDGLLVSSTGIDGAYILIPASGNFSQIRSLVRDIFGSAPAWSGSEEKTEKAKIIIQNGTWINGLAAKMSDQLDSSEFEIIKTENASTRDYNHSIVYDLSYGKMDEALNALKKSSGATQAYDSPAWLKSYQSGNSSDPDFILILGTDANQAD